MATAELKVTRSLFDIGDDFLALDALLDEREGDLTGCEEAIDEILVELRDDLHRKADSYAALIMICEKRAAARKEESDRLRALAKTDENKAKMLRERMKFFLEHYQIKAVDTDRFRISVQVNGGIAPIRLLVAPEDLPPEFQKITISADNGKIRKALDAGPVAFAELEPRGSSLRIR